MIDHTIPSKPGQLCKRHILRKPCKRSDYDVFIFLNKTTHLSIDVSHVLDLRTFQIRTISTTLLECVI
jgi:hypothetical protein